jgi:PIN domain nuclease of toxin-antitoxin system
LRAERSVAKQSQDIGIASFRFAPFAMTSFGSFISCNSLSIWETLILAEKGRISLQPNAVAWIDLALQTLEILEAPLVYQIAILSRHIELPQQDPADRFIAATVDSNLTGVSWLQTLS